MILYDVIEYLQTRISEDEDLSNDIKVLEAYKYSHTLKSTEIQVQILDHSEFERFTTFEDGKVFISPLQITIYGKQGTIGDTTVSAQKCAYILAQKVISWLNTEELNTALPEIIGARNGTYSSSVPLLNVGTVIYASVVRIDLYLQNIIDNYSSSDDESTD